MVKPLESPGVGNRRVCPHRSIALLPRLQENIGAGNAVGWWENSHGPTISLYVARITGGRRRTLCPPVLLLPALLAGREESRRATCTNNLKQINLSIYNYTLANKVFPYGTICDSVRPSGRTNGTMSGAKRHRLPGASRNRLAAGDRAIYGNCFPVPGVGLQRRRRVNAGSESAPGPATWDVDWFYCPTWRNGFRPQDKTLMQAAWWPGGGTDYGGCVGRHLAYDTGSRQHYVLDAGSPGAVVFRPGVTVAANVLVPNDGAKARWGIFGRINVNTNYGEILDGMFLHNHNGRTPADRDG